jgi:dynein heavy chain
LEYLKLEKVAFGGSKGQVLTGMVMNIFNEFNELMNKFTNSAYDPLDDTSDVR